MANRLAKQIAEKFHLKLTPELVDWFDGGWEAPIDGEYDQAEDPAFFFDPAKTVVWGGQMLPDTLPIIGNGGGDVLSVRFNGDGSPKELIRWLHEGGSWIPAGESIGEALRAVRGEFTESISTNNALLRREQCLRCLRSPLHAASIEIGGRRLAKRIGVPWPEFEPWLRDHSLIPLPQQELLSAELKIPREELLYQDWDGAAAQAAELAAVRQDLVWPFILMGYAQERAGRIEEAVRHYSDGALALGTTASFTESWSSSKFNIARLAQLAPDSLQDPVASYVQAAEKRHGIRTWWGDRGKNSEAAGAMSAAYDAYYAAGWDDFYINDMEQILADLARTSTAAGQPARAAIADYHLQARL